LHNVILLGYVTFYQINAFFVLTLFFHYWQNVFCGRVKWLHGSDLGPRAVVWRTLVKTMKRCGDSTHRGVTRGGKGDTIPGAPNHNGGRRMIAKAAEKAQQYHKYFLQYRTLASHRPQVRT